MSAWKVVAPAYDNPVDTLVREVSKANTPEAALMQSGFIVNGELHVDYLGCDTWLVRDEGVAYYCVKVTGG